MTREYRIEIQGRWFLFDPKGKDVLFEDDDRRIRLTPTERDIFVYHLERSGQFVLDDDLLDSIWQGKVVNSDNPGRQTRELRRKLADAVGLDEREREWLFERSGKLGYRFQPDHIEILQDENHLPNATEHLFNQLVANQERVEAEKDLLREENERLRALIMDAVSAIVEQRTSNTDGLAKLADDKIQRGDISAAIVLFEAIGKTEVAKGIEANWEAAEAYRRRGALACLSDTGIALESFRRATKLDPKDIESWNQLGRLYVLTGDLSSAEYAYKKLLKLKPNDSLWRATAYGNLGVAYQTGENLEGAIEMYHKSLTLHKSLDHKSGVATNYSNIGNVHQMNDELDLAIEMYDKSLSIALLHGLSGCIAIAYGNLGIVYQTKGELGTAIEMYAKSLALNDELDDKSGMAHNYFNLGSTYEKRGELDDARVFWQIALGLFEEVKSHHAKTVRAGLAGLGGGQPSRA